MGKDENQRRLNELVAMVERLEVERTIQRVSKMRKSSLVKLLLRAEDSHKENCLLLEQAVYIKIIREELKKRK